MDDETKAIIDRLRLLPHPEGGWYRETWRAPGAGGDPDGQGRSPGTAILFLLEAGARSHWHRVDADELWLWHAGAPLLLGIEGDDGTIADFRLGGDVALGYEPQRLVPANRWQAAEAIAGWALVSCVVVPGFDFGGFELAPPGWTPDQR